MEYIINESTMAIISCGLKDTQIIEENREFHLACSWKKILNDSCLHYGSSFQGRLDGSKYLLDKGYKIPIVISEAKNIIFLPLMSQDDNNCVWISFKNVVKYSGNQEETIVYFNNDNGIRVPISNYIFDSQFLKASKLERILNFIHKS